jgi:acetyltransferase-like isoleucine patch superfamily enzyme
MFKDSERQRLLRPYVLKQFVSSVMTDDERAAFWGLPEGCRMRENAKIISPENLVCGKYVWIGEGAVLDASGGLEIGDHTSIGLNVMLWSHTSWLTNVLMENEGGSPLIHRKKTKIGSGCFIAGPSVVYHGVTVADRTVILPMSVVTKDTPGNCIMSGAPAKVMREIDDAFIESELQRLGLKRREKTSP